MPELDLAPDYDHWAKMDAWSINQAAFLLHDIDPLLDPIRSIRLGERVVPSQLESAQKTYAILRKIPWQQRYPNYYIQKSGTHPAAIVFEAIKKDLPLPKALYEAIAKLSEYRRLEKENSTNGPKEIDEIKNIKQDLSTRERRNFLKTIGILVRLYFDKKSNFNRGDNKLNAFKISQTILDKAQEIGLEAEGLKSLDRKITEALELLDEEVES